MIKLTREFLQALTLVLRALAPWIAEKAHESRRQRQRREYQETIAKGGAALEGTATDLTQFWASFDDELLSEGLGGDGGQESDRKAAGRKLQGEPGLDGQPSENGSGAQSGAPQVREE